MCVRPQFATKNCQGDRLHDYLSLIHEVKYWVAQRIPLPDDANNDSVVPSSEQVHNG